MIKNYLRLAYRRLIRDKFFSVLNIAGLTVGVTSFILLALYVRHELSYDKFHTNGKRIYALARDVNTQNGPELWESYRVSYAALIKERIPEFQKMAMLGFVDGELIKLNDESFYEKGILWANNEVFEIFDFPVIEGAIKLNEPGLAVISASTAKKYFGNENPIGKLFELEEDGKFEITAVVQDAPVNSHIQFNFLISSYNALKEAAEKFDGRGGTVCANYILMPVGVDLDNLMGKIDELMLSDWPENAIRKDDNGELINDAFFFPYEDIHLKSGFTFSPFSVSDIRYVYLFGSVAILILIIACLNYINMVTAKSIKRIKEIGLRKVMGADRRQIIWQTISESFLFTFISVVIAFALAERLLPFYNDLIDRQLSLSYLSLDFVFFVIGLSFLVGVASGLYPALRLSSFQPVQALSGHSGSREKSGLRRGLVFFQFFIAQGLIVATIIIQSQLSYLQNKDLGYNREHVLYISAFDGLGDKAKVFRSELEKISGVQSVSLSNGIFQKNAISFMPLKETEGNENAEENEYFITGLFDVDEEFIPTMGMEIIQGTSFSVEGEIAPENTMVINEAAQKRLGWDNALGKKMKIWGGEKQVIGVMKDFHDESLKAEVKPTVLVYAKAPKQYVNVRLNPLEIKSTMSAIEAKWNEMVSDRPFQYQFYDEYYDSQYRKEIRLGQIFKIFSLIAISISILGLIGLTAFSAEQRLKEFGIRKVLGAKVQQIGFLLSKEFLILIIIAFGMVSPLVYLGMKDWLSEFIYRIDLSAFTFIIALVITMVIAAIPVVYQTFKVSKVNPANILRNE
jgi:putative ABC transport system permease protein